MAGQVRPARIARAAVLAVVAAAPGAATTGDDLIPTRAFTAICEISDTCHIGGGCASLPAPGEIIVQFDGTRTAMGQSETALNPLDRFSRIEDLHPLPRITDGRREVLVDLPAIAGVDRRFGLFVQPAVAAEAEPVLQPTYFILSCRDAAR